MFDFAANGPSSGHGAQPVADNVLLSVMKSNTQVAKGLRKLPRVASQWWSSSVSQQVLHISLFLRMHWPVNSE